MSWSCRATAVRWSWISWCGVCSAWVPHGAAGRVQRARLLERQDRHRAGRSRGRSDRCGHGGGREGRGALDAGRILGAHRRTADRNSRNCASYVEAAIDFPDEEIDSLSAPAIASRLAQQSSAPSIRSLAAARQGALLREGLTVVIAGKPNAGKSSLLNRLVGDEVAIVTAGAGNDARCAAPARCNLDGLPLNLVDTAGLRSAARCGRGRGHSPRQKRDATCRSGSLRGRCQRRAGALAGAQRAELEELPRMCR